MHTTIRFRRIALGAACALAAACGSSTAPPPTAAFEIELIWLGTPPSEAVRGTFDQASGTFSEIIVGQLSTVALPASFTNLSDCGLPGYPDVGRTDIRGLRIYVVVEPIDTVGGTLGSAGPCLIRPNDIPALGVMRFDSYDVDQLLDSGRLSRVVLHEMLHVLGFGTVWFDQAVIDTLTNPSDARFTGLHARVACQGQNGGATPCATSVPVHSTDGVGSRFSHWREDTFGSELMTPFLGSGATPLSATTFGSLEDLGYEVDYTLAEPFSLSTAVSLQATPPEPPLRLAEPMQPRWKLDGAGRLTPYRPRR